MQPDELAKALRHGIREGALLPGQALVQDELAKRFKVSRIPIREALRMLSAEGMVTARPGGGLAVMSLSASEVEELYDLRISLEVGLSAHIVSNASVGDITRWKQFVQVLGDERADIRAWIRHNYQYHLSMYEVSRRAHTVRIVSSLMDRTLPYARLYMDSSADDKLIHEEHAGMLSAIENRDATQLARVIHEHLRTTQRSLVESLSVVERESEQKLLGSFA